MDDETGELVTEGVVSFAPEAEKLLRDALAGTRQALIDLRATRKAINDDIRQLVADEETFVSALRPFERARQRPNTEENPDA